MGCNCKTMPSVTTMAGNAAGAASRVVRAAAKGKTVFLSAEKTEERLAVCRQCEHMTLTNNLGWMRCSQCGCLLNAIFWKAKLSTEKCPLKKWEGD